MVEFRKSARKHGEWIWIHDGSPVYTVDADLKTWTLADYTVDDGTSEEPSVPSNTDFWNPFDGKRGTGDVLSALDGTITDSDSDEHEHYLEGTLHGVADTKVMYFKHGRTQEGSWSQLAADDKFVDFSTATIGCWVSDQKEFEFTTTDSTTTKTLVFSNVNLQGRYPRSGFVSVEGINGVTDWKLGTMTVDEDSLADKDVRVFLTPDSTGIPVQLQFGSEDALAELLGTTAAAMTHITVYAYPLGTNGFGTSVRYTSKEISTITEADDMFEHDFSSATLNDDVEYEIRLRGGNGANTDIGNEVVVGLVTAGANNPGFTKDYNLSHGVKVFQVKWAIGKESADAAINVAGTMLARAIVFG